MSLAQRSETRTAHKRCATCGKAGWYRPRQRRCRQIVTRGFGNIYLCYGGLVAVARKERPVAAARPQAVALKKLEAARKKVTEKTRAMQRLATSLRMWERRCQYYSRQASMTDAEVAAAKQHRAAREATRKAARVRRGIELEGRT